jgi:hypothetical protein
MALGRAARHLPLERQGVPGPEGEQGAHGRRRVAPAEQGRPHDVPADAQGQRIPGGRAGPDQRGGQLRGGTDHRQVDRVPSGPSEVRARPMK